MPKPKISFNLADAVNILERTPATLRTLLCGLPDEFTKSSGDRENWGAYDIVGHLISGEVTDWIPRAEIILNQGENRAFVPFDRLTQFESSQGKSFEALLSEFETKRAASVETLNSWKLTAQQLSLQGIHPEFGDVTLEQLLSSWVVHDLNHIRQLVTIIANLYSETVGPWKAYLSILK